MVTVSVVSILPESFQDETAADDGSYHMLTVGSTPFWIRCSSIAAGCGLYFLLSKCAFPEPNAVLNLEDATMDNGISTQDKDDSPALVPKPGMDDDAPLAGKSSKEGSGSNTGRLRKKESAMTRASFQESDDIEASSMESRSFLYSSDKPSPRATLALDHKGRSWWSMDRIVQCSSGKDLQTIEARRAWRVAMLLFVSIAVHNFPEGLAVAASTLHSTELGWTTATAIALHNIPEGIAIAVPCLAARPDAPWLAFGLASLSGLAEPFGAAVALAVIHYARKDGAGAEAEDSFWSLNNILAFVAGVMIMVAVTELFPEALRHSREGKWPLISGTVAGAAVMIGSDMFLQSQEMVER
jgi:ZIP family zinc transporter